MDTSKSKRCLGLVRPAGLTARPRIPAKPNLLCTNIDYKGVVYGTQPAIHFMKKNKVSGGNIVATGSVAAMVPREAYPEYDGARQRYVMTIDPQFAEC